VVVVVEVVDVVEVVVEVVVVGAGPGGTVVVVVKQHKSAGTSYQVEDPLGNDPAVRIKLPGTIFPCLLYLTNARFFAILINF
jgi:hypothetical protein